MTDAVTISLIVACQAVVVALITRQGKNIKKIEVATNSMKDALVASTAKASRAEGKAEGRAELRSEQQNKINPPNTTP